MFSEQNAKAGVTFPQGFKAAGVRAGIKKSGNLDVAVIYTEKEAAVAGTFTQNAVAAAPVFGVLLYIFVKMQIGTKMTNQRLGSIIRETFGFFGTLFQGRVQSTDVAGPVGTIAYISEAVRYGFETVLQFAVLINVSLGIFNLLPIPALDGGRLVFLVIEAIRGKPIDARKEGMVHFVGLIALFALIIFLTYNDIINLIRG